MMTDSIKPPLLASSLFSLAFQHVYIIMTISLGEIGALELSDKNYSKFIHFFGCWSLSSRKVTDLICKSKEFSFHQAIQ